MIVATWGMIVVSWGVCLFYVGRYAWCGLGGMIVELGGVIVESWGL